MEEGRLLVQDREPASDPALVGEADCRPAFLRGSNPLGIIYTTEISMYDLSAH